MTVCSDMLVAMRLCGCVLSLLLISAASCSPAAPEVADANVPTGPSLRVVHEAPGPAWSAYEAPGQGRTVRIFVAHDDQPRPVVFLLQGSGCMPAFTREADGRYDTTSVFQDVVRSEAARVVHFAVVEKPGVVTLGFSAGMTREQKVDAFERASRECTAAFFTNATKDVRVADVRDAIAAVSSQPWARGVILAGHSEGTHVTTGVLSLASKGTIVAAGLFASAGPVPFWTGYAASGGGNRAEFQSTFDRIRTLQAAPDDEMYQGLPARRWKTFWLKSTPIEDVRDSDVPLFVAQGTRDGTLLGADLFALEAIRQQPARSLRYVVVDQADHGFGLPDGASTMPAVFNDFLNWALDSKRPTGTGVIR